MRSIILVLTGFLLVLSGGCKKESPTSPQESQQTLPIASSTIGPAGGSIQGGGFSLTVPPGSFTSSATLSLYASSDDHPFSDCALSSLVELDGLPAQFNNPLTVRIKYQDSTKSGKVIAIGETTTDFITGEQVLAYRRYKATDSSGYLISVLAARPNGTALQKKATRNKTGSNVTNFRFVAAFNQVAGDVLAVSSHFAIGYSKSTISQALALQLVDACEHAYGVIKNMGLFQTWFSPDNPFPILLEVTKDLDHMPERYAICFVNFPVIYLDEYKVLTGNTAGLQRDIGFGVFWVLTQQLYRSSQYPNAEKLDLLSIAVWSEEKFVSDNVVPFGFVGNASVPFLGLDVDPRDYSVQPTPYGGGMSAFIKYLVGKYGEKIIPGMVTDLFSGKELKDIVINYSQGDAEYVWWEEFMRNYITGKIYDVTSSDLLSGISSWGSFTIQGKTDTLKLFRVAYPYLSAKLFKINLNYPTIAADARLRCGVDAHKNINAKWYSVIVFGLKNGNLETLCQGAYGAEATVESLGVWTSAGYNFVAAVVNSLNETGTNTAQDTIDLTVSVDIPTVTQGYLAAHISGTMHYSDSGQDEPDHLDYNDYSGGTVWRNGTLAAGKFTAIWNDTQSDVTGSLTISLDNSTPPHVNGFTLQQDYLDPASGEKEAWKISSSANCNIAPYGKSYAGDHWLYKITGTDMATQMGTVYYRFDEPEPNAPTYWKQWVSSTYDAMSWLELGL
jgi:hypothetical protein